MSRSSEPTRTGRRTSKDQEDERHRSRSPRKDKQQRGDSPRPRPKIEPDATPRPLSFAVFVRNRPMTEGDFIIKDPDVAVEFARQIFPPEVQQSMVERRDFEVFRDGIHGAVKWLYTAYDVSMHLQEARRESEKKDERNRSLEIRVEKAERELRELKNVQTSTSVASGQSKLVVVERVTQRTSSYEKGFQNGLKVGIEKTKQDLAEEVCRCENRGFKHDWIKALQTEEALEAVGIDSASPLYHHHYFPCSDFEIEKSDDEGAE
ncbi:hypothetical protein CsSME_00028824 [Camellia sinensis var. sinensis]